MRTRILTPLLLLATATVVGAQDPAPRIAPELRPYVGMYLPTGAMQDAFKSAATFGAQGALELSRNFHVLGTFAYTPGHTKLVPTNDRTNILAYDLGFEGNLVRPLPNNWLFRPFVGAGGGARTYDYKAAALSTKTCTAGYGALGTEFQTGPTALRLEGRNYWSCFQSPLTGRKTTRSDVGLSLGLAYHFR